MASLSDKYQGLSTPLYCWKKKKKTIMCQISMNESINSLSIAEKKKKKQLCVEFQWMNQLIVNIQQAYSIGIN